MASRPDSARHDPRDRTPPLGQPATETTFGDLLNGLTLDSHRVHRGGHEGGDVPMSTFLANASADEVDIAIQNVSLSELTKPPYKASISFQKVLYTPGTRTERARQSYVAQVDFVLRDHVPNEFVRVNPLGLQVSYFRVDQAFEEKSR